MKLKVVIHEAEEGGYWAEVPSILGCATQGETFEELLKNIGSSGNRVGSPPFNKAYHVPYLSLEEKNGSTNVIVRLL